MKQFRTSDKILYKKGGKNMKNYLPKGKKYDSICGAEAYFTAKDFGVSQAGVYEVNSIRLFAEKTLAPWSSG